MLVGRAAGRRLFRSPASFSRSTAASTAGLEREITFGDVTFPVASLGYRRVQHRHLSPGGELCGVPAGQFRAWAIAAGVHATDVEVAIEGEGRVGDSGLRFERRSRKPARADADRRVVRQRPTSLPRLSVGGRVDYFSMEHRQVRREAAQRAGRGDVPHPPQHRPRARVPPRRVSRQSPPASI